MEQVEIIIIIIYSVIIAFGLMLRAKMKSISDENKRGGPQQDIAPWRVMMLSYVTLFIVWTVFVMVFLI